MRSRLLRRVTQRDERGMTLIELVVTVALTAIVMAMATFILIHVLNETAGEQASISGVQQSQIAERSFTQYLRSSVSLLSVQASDLTFTSYAGSVSGVPQLQTIETKLCPTQSKFVDSLEVIYGIQPSDPQPNGLHECISASSPTSTTSAVPPKVRLVEAFDVLPPAPASTDIFSYYQLGGSAFNKVTTGFASTHPCSIAAIGINLTFLPPPGGANKGYHAELGTTLQTEIFLRNYTTTC